jgi:hypothetical protein
VHRNSQDTPSLGKLTEADLDAAIARKYPLHPLIAFALRPLTPLALPLPPTVYRGATGRRRAFLSFSDAAAYDRGYRSFPQSIPMHAEPGTPEAMGYCDASDEAEGTAGMDDMAEWARAHADACGKHL